MAEYILKKISYREPAKPCAGLFDRIILAIKQEKEFKQTKKLLFIFVFLFFISIAVIPFSASFFISQWKISGTAYFISTALGNFNALSGLWQDFLLSILESLPVMGITLFALNIALLLFSIRLFIHRKGLLLKYLKYNFI